MKTASRILGTAFFLEGFEVQDAPRYGAERRGAPVFAYVRADRRPIQERGVIQTPDVLIVADDTLLQMTAAGVQVGADEHTCLLVETRETAHFWKERLKYPGEVLVLSAPRTEDRVELPYISAACAGAAARLVGVISRDSMKQAVEKEMAKLGEGPRKNNLEQALKAYDRLSDHAGRVVPRAGKALAQYSRPKWVEMPFERADISAPVVHGAATSELSRTGLWRTMRPVIEYEHCKHCWWFCSTYCPDSAIAVLGDGRPQIDYAHCKGCLICVAQCPSHAIVAVSERQFEQAGQEDAT